MVIRIDPNDKPDGLIWITKDGRKVNLKEMTPDHLDNTIALLERKLGTYLMIYEMDAIVQGNPYDARLVDFDADTQEETFDFWIDLCALRDEREKRNGLGEREKRNGLASIDGHLPPTGGDQL